MLIESPEEFDHLFTESTSNLPILAEIPKISLSLSFSPATVHGSSGCMGNMGNSVAGQLGMITGSSLPTATSQMSFTTTMGDEVMQKFLAVCLVVVALAAVNSNAMAGEKASTDEVPAALQALGVDDSRVLSSEEADEIRGEALTGQIVLTITGPGFTSQTAVGFAGVTAITAVGTPTPTTLFGIGNTNFGLLIQ